jgi:5'-nucleotidase
MKKRLRLNMKVYTILVDLDNTCLDLLGRVEEMWREKYPNKSVPIYKNWRFNEDYENLYHGSNNEIITMYRSEECIINAEPIPWAIEALNEMVAEGHNVFICTTPVGNYTHCASDKYAWVEKYLGKEWMRRLILTVDKTLIRADLIIDDKPTITGLTTPIWEHILFTRPYNTNLEGKRRLTDWRDWRSLL